MVDDPRRLAFLPTCALLGVALPLAFLPTIGQYLYYLRLWELIPTYGTAWLFLGALIAPASLTVWLALAALNRPSTRRIFDAVGLILIAITGATLAATLCHDTLVWFQTWGLLKTTYARPANELVALSLAAGVLIAIVRAGRTALLSMFALMKYATVLGAFSLLSLPFSGWSADKGPLQSNGNPAIAASGPRPNILLVTIDALSAEHMSLYGAARNTTPRLEAFGRGATIFDRAYANGNFTTPGVSSILTATRPWTHRALQLTSWPLSTERRNSLPALLVEAGYQTGYVATNPYAGAAKNGLGAYFTFRASDRLQQPPACNDGLATLLPYACAAAELTLISYPELLWTMLRQYVANDSSNRQSDPRLAMRPALEWLARADKRRPVFLWVHFLPPHYPYAAPEPWLGQFDSSPAARHAADSNPEGAFLSRRLAKGRIKLLEARYDESVKYIDSYVGEFLEHAQELIGQNSVVVVTADHGESFAHGYGAHGGPGLFESLIHIPLIIKLPSQTQGLHVPDPVEQVDVAPTLAMLAGSAPPVSWEGRSLLGLARPSEGGAPEAARPVYAMNFEENPRRSALTVGAVAVIDGQWKLVHVMGALHYPLMPRLNDELYDLSADPLELTNRLREEPSKTERLRALIESQLAQHGAPLP